jgi:ribosomal protein S18 acetylase RimI-like enzyme
MDGFNVAEIVIRSITLDDADILADMWLSLVASHQALDDNLPAAARGGEHRYVRRVMDRLSDPYTCALMAEVDGQAVGYVLAMVVDLMPDIFAEPPAGFLADIYVEPAFRRQGVGRSLVGIVQDWFRQCGVQYFDWQVAAHNPAGLAFWRSIGGQEVMLRMRVPLGVKND